MNSTLAFQPGGNVGIRKCSCEEKGSQHEIYHITHQVTAVYKRLGLSPKLNTIKGIEKGTYYFTFFFNPLLLNQHSISYAQPSTKI